MTTYIVQRVVQAVAMLCLLSVLFFLLVRFQPGQLCAFGDQTCVSRLNLDTPISTQYLQWLGDTLHGNFGLSRGGQPVALVIEQKLPPTILLVGVSFVIQQMLALPLGILAAARQYSLFDGAFSVLSYIALSFPGFVLGLLLLFVFCVHWHLLPVGHYESVEYPLLWSNDWFAAFAADPIGVSRDLALHLMLPAFVLTVTGIAVDGRFMRASMLQVLSHEFIRTARGKGISRRRVIFKHALRNALPPVITNMALYLPAFVGGIIVVEQVFTWGGLGNAFNTGVATGDFGLLQAVLLMTTTVVVIANLLADIAYGWLDPRVRYDD